MHIFQVCVYSLFSLSVAWTYRKKENCKKTEEREEESPKKSARDQKSKSVSWEEEIVHFILYRTCMKIGCGISIMNLLMYEL